MVRNMYRRSRTTNLHCLSFSCEGNFIYCENTNLNHFKGLENHYLQIVRTSKANQFIYTP